MKSLVFKEKTDDFGLVASDKNGQLNLQIGVTYPYGRTDRLLTLKEEEELLALLVERKNAREPNQIDQLVKRRELTEMRRKAGYDDAPHCVSDMIAAFCQFLNVPMIAWSVSIVIENENQFNSWFAQNYPPII